MATIKAKNKNRKKTSIKTNKKRKEKTFMSSRRLLKIRQSCESKGWGIFKYGSLSCILIAAYNHPEAGKVAFKYNYKKKNKENFF